VIYAQTDSVFIHFPSASSAQAVALGKAAAQLVGTCCCHSSSFPPFPASLKVAQIAAWPPLPAGSSICLWAAVAHVARARSQSFRLPCWHVQVTAGLPPPMELKYERVMQPFMLLHVNRQARLP
jgi:hypothetical protein